MLSVYRPIQMNFSVGMYRQNSGTTVGNAWMMCTIEMVSIESQLNDVD